MRFVSSVFPEMELEKTSDGFLDPKNAALRTKLRKAFAQWYDDANSEQNENCVILAIRITRGTVMKDHGAVRYNMDFVNKVETEEGIVR